MDLNTISAVAQPRARTELPAWRDGDAFLGGGTWLYSEPQPGLTRLIDLAGLGWTPLTVTPAGLEIAATCTIAKLDALSAPVEWTASPLIGQCCRAFLASFKIWNTATVGGNLCMALPAGPMIALTVALDGVCTLWTPDGGVRQMPAMEFIRGPQHTVLKAGELLRRIDLPAVALMKRTTSRQISLSPLGRSAALLIGTRTPRGHDFTLTVTGSTPRPVQLAFDRIPSAAALRAHIEQELPPAAYYDDVHGTPDWRRTMTLLLAGDIRDELAAEPPR